MGRELQKRKRRSSRPTVRTHNYRKKALNPQGSNIVAQEWDKKETLSQNYSRFGLVSKLGATGLSSKSTTKKTKSAPAPNPLAHNPSDRGLIRVQEVKVERDAQGRITRVIRDANPLRDPLNDVLDSESDSDGDDGDDGEEWGGIDAAAAPRVVRELEREAAQPTEKLVRHQSEREMEWLGDLVAKHGEDVAAMARDAKLNRMQQTAADIRKRLRKAGLLA